MKLALACFVINPFVIGACFEFAPAWLHIPVGLIFGIYWFGCLMVLINGEKK